MRESAQAARHRLRLSVADGLHCISTPVTVYPYAPRGEQKAPGWTPCRYAGVVGGGGGCGSSVVATGGGTTGTVVVGAGEDGASVGLAELASDVGDDDAVFSGPVVAWVVGAVVAGLPPPTTAAIAVPPQHSTSRAARIPRISGSRDFFAAGTA